MKVSERIRQLKVLSDQPGVTQSAQVMLAYQIDQLTVEIVCLSETARMEGYSDGHDNGYADGYAAGYKDGGSTTAVFGWLKESFQLGKIAGRREAVEELGMG